MNEEEVKYSTAVIGTVYEDGVTLIFPGSDTESEKHYKCNTNIYFQANDRVKIFEDSGSYIVEYIIGNPSSQPSPSDVHGIPTGGTADQVLAKNSATDYDAGWTTPHYIPSGGTTGQVLAKTAGTNYSVGWADPSVNSVKNYYSTTTQNSSTYNIYFKTNTSYNPSTLSWRMGTSGTWHDLT